MPIFPPSQKPADLAMWQEGPALTAFTKPNPPGSCQEGGCVVEITHLALVSQSASIKWAQKVVGGGYASCPCQMPEARNCSLSPLQISAKFIYKKKEMLHYTV